MWIEISVVRMQGVSDVVLMVVLRMWMIGRRIPPSEEVRMRWMEGWINLRQI